MRQEAIEAASLRLIEGTAAGDNAVFARAAYPIFTLAVPRKMVRRKLYGRARRPSLYLARASGRMAEWLCRGLQILVQRFDSASGLQCRHPRMVASLARLCYKPASRPTRVGRAYSGVAQR